MACPASRQAVGLCLLSSQADEAGHRLLTGFVASPLPRAAMGEDGVKPRTGGREGKGWPDGQVVDQGC